MSSRAILATLGQEYCLLCGICLLTLISIYRVVGSTFEQDDALPYFKCTIFFSALAAFSDIGFGIREFQLFPMNLSMGYFFEILYALSSMLSSYCWFIYSETRQKSRIVGSRLWRVLICIPIGLIIALLVTTPSTHLIFSLDSGSYVRGPLNTPLSVLASVFVVASGITALVHSFDKRNYTDRNQLRLLFVFAAGISLSQLVQVVINSVMPILTMGTTGILLIVTFRTLRQRITVDGLTRINNRFALDRYLGQRFASGESFYLIMLDLDDFKQINDRYGHVSGDRALKLVATVIAHSLPSGFFVSRYGGDEFSVVGSCSETEIEILQERFRENLRAAGEEAGLEFPLRLSIGCALRTSEYETIPDLIKAADTRLYQDKKNHSGENSSKSRRRGEKKL